MGLLDRVIKKAVGNAVSNAVGNAVEKGVRQAVEPKLEQAVTKTVNSAARQINSAAGTQNQTAPAQSSLDSEQVSQAASTLGGLFGSLESFANEAAKDMKICPSCGASAGKDVKFCPSCGEKLPEMTVAEGAVCPDCGRQNRIGTKFCADCGAKLPSALAEENASRAQDEREMAKWDTLLSQYPKWNIGGSEVRLEQNDGYIDFSVRMESDAAAQNAVRQYRALLSQNGFVTAGEYPDVAHLYKMTDGVCYHCDTEHCFDGDGDCPYLIFDISQPGGGFYYVKPEPKKQVNLRDLFKF